MITADRIRKLSYLDTQQVEQAVRKNYPKDSFVSTKFLELPMADSFVIPLSLLTKATSIAPLRSL